MNKYLIGISFHEPKDYELYLKGKVEDFESSTGIFVIASSEDEAIMWGEEIAKKLFKKLNPDEIKSWESFGHFSWIERDLSNSGWNQCVDSFQCVALGEFPDLDTM